DMRRMRSFAFLFLVVSTIWARQANVFADLADLQNHVAAYCDNVGNVNPNGAGDWYGECSCTSVPSSCYTYASQSFCREFLDACRGYCIANYCPMNETYSYCNVAPYGAAGHCQCTPLDSGGGCGNP